MAISVGTWKNIIFRWWSVARKWIDDQTDEVVQDFNARYFANGKPMYHGVDVYIPVVCVEAPIYQVDLARMPDAGAFAEVGLSLSGVRVPGWPGPNRESIVAAAAEGLVVVVWVSALFELLASVRDYFAQIVATLASSDERVTRRSVLEAAFIRDAIHTYAAFDDFLGQYRSDLDLGAP
jgi:hypothetical protein